MNILSLNMTSCCRYCCCQWERHGYTSEEWRKSRVGEGPFLLENLCCFPCAYLNFINWANWKHFNSPEQVKSRNELMKRFKRRTYAEILRDDRMARESALRAYQFSRQQEEEEEKKKEENIGYHPTNFGDVDYSFLNKTTYYEPTISYQNQAYVSYDSSGKQTFYDSNGAVTGGTWDRPYY